jgi:hypothetical protein
MSKRNRGSLTGGTGDVNPQWFNLPALTMGNAYVDVSSTLPRERLPYGNLSQVMEVLKVEFSLATTSVLNATVGTNSASRMYLTTRTFGTVEPTTPQNNGGVVTKWRIELPSTAASATAEVFQGVYLSDLTDGAGHGMLVATDNVFLGGIQTAATSPINGVVNVRLLYRWKNVQLQEYIGIVQSQQ